MSSLIELYEKRIESAYTARDRCVDEWGYNYWTKVAGALLRKLNYYMNEDQNGRQRMESNDKVQTYH